MRTIYGMYNQGVHELVRVITCINHKGKFFLRHHQVPDCFSYCKEDATSDGQTTPKKFNSGQWSNGTGGWLSDGVERYHKEIP